MRRLILVPLLIVVAFLAIGGGIAYVIYNNYMYYSTDDAQVNGTIVNISAPTTGVLTTLTVKVGDTVSAGQTIGTVTPASAAAAMVSSASSSSAGRRMQPSPTRSSDGSSHPGRVLALNRGSSGAPVPRRSRRSDTRPR